MVKGIRVMERMKVSFFLTLFSPLSAHSGSRREEVNQYELLRPNYVASKKKKKKKKKGAQKTKMNRAKTKHAHTKRTRTYTQKGRQKGKT